MNRISYTLIGVLLVAALGVGAWLWWQQRMAPRQVPQAPPAVLLPSPTASAAPAIKHPIALPPAAAPLPALDQSDSYIMNALVDLLGKEPLATFLRIEDFPRRVVATVDNLARPHAAPRLWPVQITPGRFGVDNHGDGERVIAAGNARRYAPFIAFIESVNVPRAAALYVHMYPLFQKAYENIGYPGRYFNDRLVAVIDLLLDTPTPQAPLLVELTEVKGPEKLLRPWVNYQFSDAGLESLSSGQKILLRMGPDNARRLKVKLMEIRAQVAGRKAAR